MYVKLVLTFTVFSAVFLIINCEKSYDGRPMQAYTRIKRGKYNSGPLRFYNRPPVSFPIKGVFSYTPPPNYMAEDENIQYPGPPGFYSRPHKVSKPIDDDLNDNVDPSVSNLNMFSKRPSNEGLGDDDLNNIVKYLSKQDLNKIINLAGGRDSENERYTKNNIQNDVYNVLQDFNAGNSDTGEDNTNIFKALVKEIDTHTKYSTVRQAPKFSFENNGPLPKLVTEPTPNEAYFTNSQINFHDTAALEAEESKLKSQISYLKSQITDGVVYTDSKMMPEEALPKPMNLREEQDYDVSYTNNVPTVVKAEQSQSYKLENFGDLPLMNNKHKLDTLSSYHVPHYTITSSSSLASTSYGAKVPSVEPAPPASVAKAQSDAHLKAVKIWSHKSKGTAYTLHDDGTLSLEKPGRPPGSYGYP